MNAIVTDYVSLLAAEDDTAKEAIVNLLQAELAQKKAAVGTVTTPITADEIIKSAPSRDGIVLEVARTRAAAREALLKADDAPISGAITVPPAQTSHDNDANTLGAVDQSRRQEMPLIDPTQMIAPTPAELTAKEKKSVESGLRWITKSKGKPSPCYICVNRRDGNQSEKDKTVKAGQRCVYWPMQKDSRVEYFFFHGPCWASNPQFEAASGKVLGPDPMPAIDEVATAKAKDNHGEPDASKLAGGMPVARSAADIQAEAIKEAAIARAYAPRPSAIQQMAIDAAALSDVAKAFGFEKLDVQAVTAIAGMASALRDINAMLVPPRRESLD